MFDYPSLHIAVKSARGKFGKFKILPRSGLKDEHFRPALYSVIYEGFSFHSLSLLVLFSVTQLS